MIEAPDMKVRCVAPWFGSKRSLAQRIVAELGPHKSYWNPTVGSFAVEMVKPQAAHEHVNDLHGELINLARTIQDPKLGPQLYRWLRRTWSHETFFAESKQRIESIADEVGLFGVHFTEDLSPLERAYLYFIVSWQGRNGVAGTERVNYQPSVRWTSGGGHGGIRFSSAVNSIPAWRRRMRRLTILQRDLFDIIPRIEDQEGTVIYIDPPYLRDGARTGNCAYLHEFKPSDHLRLAKELRRFKKVRIVVSYYEHDLLRELYHGWTFVDCVRQKNLHVQNRRGVGTCEAPEVLIVNGPSFTSDNWEGGKGK